MPVIGARFSDRSAALAALGAIRVRVAALPGDVAVRPLGSTHYEEPARDFILAGRFETDDVSPVIEILEGHGGRVLRPGADGPDSLGSTSPGGVDRSGQAQ